MTTELTTFPATGLTLGMPRQEAVDALCNKINQGIRLRKLRIWSVGQLDKAREQKQAWTLAVTKLLTQIFGREQEADEFNRWSGKILPEFAGLAQFTERYISEMDQRLKKLVAILKTIEEDPAADAPGRENRPSNEVEKNVEAATHEPMAREPTASAGVAAHAGPQPPTERAAAGAEQSDEPAAPRSGALILLSRDEAVEEAVGRFVTLLGYELVVVGTDEVGTKALVEKLGHDQPLDFAVVLADRPQENPSNPAGKWDFELGFCAGRLGAGRVCVLHVGALGVSYDGHGLLHIPVDPADGWQLHLARQLKRAGIPIDLNRLC